MSTGNIIRIQPGLGWFLGRFANNQAHRHFALQLSISLNAPIHLRTEGGEISSRGALLIRSNQEHQLFCEKEQFLLLLNPSSPPGHFWKSLAKAPVTEVSNETVEAIKMQALKLLSTSVERETTILSLERVLSQQDCFCGTFVHGGDSRIEKAIAYLDLHRDRIIPVAEIADHCHLSASRFQHLFKAETGQTYRRAQLWNKITAAFPQLGKQSLTSLAHDSGFADSAHFSRTFKENFGFSPRELLKVSSFIQV